jgi:uncharacterized protein YoxC
MPWPDFCRSGEHAKQSTLLEVQQSVQELQVSVSKLATQMEKIMTQDATVLAAVQAIEADLTQAATVLTNIQAAVAALQAEVAAGGTNAISDATMQELANAQSQADAFLAAETADAASDTPPVTPSPDAPPAS